MWSVVHVGLVHTTVWRWGGAEGGGGIVEGIPPVVTLVVGVYEGIPQPLSGHVALGNVLSCWVTGLWWGMFSGGVMVSLDLIDEAGEANPTSGSDGAFSQGLPTKSLNVSLILRTWERALSTSFWRVFSSCVSPAFWRIAPKSSEAMVRACSRRRSVLYRGLMSVEEMSSMGAFR